MKMDAQNKKTKEAIVSKADGISAITVGCFKSIHDKQRIEISPLTLLAGANSSGKSSIMQPVLLLKQTLEAGYDPGALLLNGPNVIFTSTEQFLCGGSGSKRINHFSVGIETTLGHKIQFSFRKEGKKAIYVEKIEYSANGISLVLSQNSTQDDIKRLLKMVKDLDIMPDIFKGISKNLKNSSLKITSNRCFLTVDDSSNLFSDEQFITSLLIHEFNRLFRRNDHYITSIIHLPGLRGNPQRDYQKTASGPAFPGSFQDYVAGIVLDWKENKDPRLGKLGILLQKLGLTWKIDASPINDTNVEIKVGRTPSAAQGGARDLVSIADVGFGVSQSLPVLVALLVAEPGHTVYLEQPEIHLHPRAQVAMADIIADASKRGVRVIAETHSALLLLRIQTLVAKGALSPDIVKLHWFSRNETDGFTTIESADLDRKGSYDKDWPEDFGKIMMDAEKAYLNAADECD